MVGHGIYGRTWRSWWNMAFMMGHGVWWDIVGQREAWWSWQDMAMMVGHGVHDGTT